ncbi:MAG: methyltransferase domain-containing protein, partial [archaeon]|nr:methyltransferase domain-containing protein [archaeon]
TVLDLGCGTGRDVYIVSKLVGESGRSIGIDMTDEQLDVARAHVDSQMSRFGFGSVNVEFRKGFIEDLASAGIPDGSVDVVISNCVINLSPEKEKIFSEIHRVLRKGGELYFSDVFADRRVPQEIYDDPVLHGECLSGAMYVEDFRRLMAKVGFADFRYMSVSKVTIENDDVKRLVGDINFTSRTVRAFKIDGLEDICENYGQVATYIGGIPGHEMVLDLDGQHRFIKGIPKKVCGNTAAMVTDTRFAPYFKVEGDRSRHYGVFGDCCDAPEEKQGCCCEEPEPGKGSCCCCH